MITTKESGILASAKRNMLAIFAMAIAIVSLVAAKTEYNPVVSFFTSAGQIRQPTRVWDGIITPSTGNGQVIDISSAGFSSINSITITPANNTTSVTAMPLVAIKSYTSSQVVINILASNNQLVSVLGTTVTPLVTATTLTGFSVHVRVDGW